MLPPLRWSAAFLFAAVVRSQNPGGELPYDLAFDQKEFLGSAGLAVASTGAHVAFEVRHPPADRSLGERYMPNGSPSSVVGSAIHVVEVATRRTLAIAAGGNAWRPSWSPDGRSLAFYCDAGGPVRVWMHDLASGASRQVAAATVKAKLWSGDEPRWHPDGTTVFVPLAPAGEFHSPVRPTAAAVANAAGVRVLLSGSEVKAASDTVASNPRRDHYRRENLATLGAIDIRTGAVRVVVPAEATPAPSVLRLSASGTWLSYLSVFKDGGANNQLSTMDLAVVPAAGGAVHTLAADLPQLDDYFNLNYCWHPSRDLLVYVQNQKLHVVEFGPDGAGAPRVLGAGLGALAPTVNWFTRDGAAVVVGTDPFDDKGYADVRPRGIAVVPLAGGESRTFAIDDARWQFRGVLKADERTVWQPDGTSVHLDLLARASGERNIVRFDPRTGAAAVVWHGLARIERLTGGGRHDFLFGTYEDLATAPDVHRFGAEWQKERVSHVDPRLDDVAAGTAEIFLTTVPLHDGTLATVRTAVLLPRGKQRGDRLPAIVMMYPGGDVTREAMRFGGGGTLSLPTLLFTSRGFAVVLANLTLGPNREAGNPVQEMVDVLLPQVYHAAELGYVDLQRLAISGQSFGGYGTAAILTRTNLFRCAVAVSGIYDLFGTYGHMGPDGSSFWIGWSEGGQARMGSHPWADVRRYLANSPYYDADKIRTPLLLVHGTDDMAYHDAQKLFTALRRLDRPAQFAAYTGQDHVISEWSQASAVDAAERMVAFYRRHLLAVAAPK